MNDRERGTPAHEVEPDRRTTTELQAEERALLELARGELEVTRKAAETWRTGLAGLTAIVTGALFIKGKDSVDDIAHPWNVYLGIALGIAIAAAVIGTLFALRASAGEPKQTSSEEIRKAGGIEAFRRKLAADAASDLHVAQFFAVAAVVLLAVAVGISWYAPEPHSEPPAQLRVTAGGEQICGTNKGVSAGKIVLRPRAGIARWLSATYRRSRW
jgi:hypothetical protein